MTNESDTKEREKHQTVNEMFEQYYDLKLWITNETDDALTGIGPAPGASPRWPETQPGEKEAGEAWGG